MIKNLEKDLRTYRKDTFITSFFATLTILLIVLIICSVPSHAATISGTNTNGDSFSYDDDSSNMTTITDNYNVDTTLTSPQGLLNKADSNVQTLIPDRTNIDNAPDVYYLSSLDVNSSADGWLSRSIPKSWVYNGTTYNLSDFSNFALLSSALNPAGGGFFELCLSDSSFGYYYTGRYLNQYDITSDGTCFMLIGNTSNNDFVIKSGTSTTYDYSSLNVDFQKTTNSLHNSYDTLVYSNCSVTGLSYVLNEQGNARVYSSADGMEYNYLNGQNGNGGGSVGGESPGNNLVMTNGDWIFKNSKYSAPYDSSFPTGSIYPSGSVSFSFDPTEYQSTNPSAFELVFTFYFQYDVDYKNWNQAFSVFEETSQLLNNTKRYSHTYNYNDNGAVEIILPLSEFIENGNSKSWTWQDIFDKLENGAFTSVLNNSRELYSVSYNKFDLYATAYIKTADSKSGSITEWYNPMSKKGYTTDDSGSLNKNPYVPTDSTNNDGNAPGEGGNNPSGTVNSAGGVTIYNYNNNNNNGGSISSDTNNFTNVFNKLIGDNKVTSESIAGSTGVNGFLTFMNNTISSVPVLFFTHLLTFFTTCLAILVVAFVLRMLLDIL